MSHRVLIILALLLSITGCSSANAFPLPYVNLSQRQPLPAIAEAEVVPLRIAVAAIISPQSTVESYSQFADYLSKQLGVLLNWFNGEPMPK